VPLPPCQQHGLETRHVSSRWYVFLFIDNHNDGHNNDRGYHDSSSSINGSNSISNRVPAAQARDATRLELLVYLFFF
jgi:hypothetical protein